MGKGRAGILAGISLALTAFFYGRAWRFDLQCDDLLVVRPWSRAELMAVWHNTWEPGHTFATFFRPVASWFYAGTFALFGWNAPAHMLLSLAMLAIVAWLLALVVARESGSRGAGALAILFYLGHPNVPWSTGTWVTNDFHKLTAISALCALLLWQHVRGRPASRWLLLVPFVLVCFLVKEDGLMLIPALISLQWARAKLAGDVKAPGLPLIAAGALAGAALIAWRMLALRELGGFPLPDSVEAVVRNLARGPIYAFTLHGNISPLTVFEMLLAVVVVIFVALGIALMPREKRFLPVAGLLLMFWYDLPLSLISNVMRYYMLTIASAMVVVPVYLAWASQPVYRWVTAVWLAMWLIASHGMSRQQDVLTLFAPCQLCEHSCVAWNLDEISTLPPEARTYVADTARACAIDGDRRPHIGETGTLTWGLGATSIDTATGDRAKAVDGAVVMLIRGDAATTRISVRHPEASASHPVRVEIDADGGHVTRELVSSDWTAIDVALRNGLRSWMRGAHRVDATFSVPGAEWKLVGESKKQRP